MHSLPSLPDFSKASVLVIGDLMLDRYWFGDTTRISPEGPVPVINVEGNDERPGGAGNVALNIASLGASVTLIGIIGQDEAGKTLCQQLNAASVKHDLCVEADVATIIKLRVISRHQQMLRLDFEKKIAPHHQSALLSRVQANLAHVNLVILSDYQKGTLSDSRALIQLIKAAKVPVIVDPKSNDFGIYQNADLMTPNLKEFESVVGHCATEQILIDKGRRLLHRHHINQLLITRGHDGMTLIEKNDSLHLPAYAKEVVDVTGAGDTVVGVLGASIAAGLDVKNAMGLANLAASLVVSKLGATAVSTAELQSASMLKAPQHTGLVNEEQLASLMKTAQSRGKKIVFTNGCFDILHAGHVTCLQMAKDLADYLVVAVNADESIRKLKGPNRPINNLEHRMIVFAGLGVVDWVVPFSDETPNRLLNLLKPDILIKGDDYKIDQVVGKEIVEAYGGEVRIVNNHFNETSSSSIINRIMRGKSSDGESSSNSSHG